MKKITLLLLNFMFFNAALHAQNWVNGGNSLSANGTFGTNTNFSVIFETNNTERGRITNTGLFGFGTTAPSGKFHINSSSGQNALRAAVNGSTKLLVHSGGGTSIGSSSTPPANGLFVSGNVGIGTATPEQTLHVIGNEILSTGSGAGFKFRNRGSFSNFDDWVWYSQDNIARFWRAGAGDLIGITTRGNVGIGTTDPGNYKLKVVHGSDGLNLENASSGNNWELYVIGGDNHLTLSYNTSLRGSFSSITGSYSSNSDERLKTNIKDMSSILDKVNQLKPTTYQFKAAKTNTTEGNTPESYGFLAQDVMKIFPNIVTHHVDKERDLDTYTMDYSSFGVLSIKAIQEQQQEINELKVRLAKLEASIGANNNSSTTNPKELIGVSLEQNQPNPFNQITTFRYKVPAGVNAQILIYDVTSGNLIKSMPAPASGQAQINANDLKPGIYTYTLMVNGEVAASKKMILNK